MDVDWTHVIIAMISGLAAGVPATLMAMATLVSSWKNSNKIDQNTELTKAGAVSATANAKVAADAASSAESKVDDLSVKLNGELDRKIKAIVGTAILPIQEFMEVHTKQDEDNMSEIRNAIAELIVAVKAEKGK